MYTLRSNAQTLFSFSVRSEITPNYIIELYVNKKNVKKKRNRNMAKIYKAYTFITSFS
jgi:hypothetical protein